MSFQSIAKNDEPKLVTIVPGEGPLDCKIAFVGEAPGEKERLKGRPFVGPAGIELDKILHSAGITRSSCYITNCIKEQPEGNKIAPWINPAKGYISPAAQVYVDQLKEELSQCSANVIVAVGGTALFVLTQKVGILKWRSSILESTLVSGRKIIPTIHPSALLHAGGSSDKFDKNRGSGMYIWRHFILFDLMRAVEESQYPELRLPAMRLHVRPTFSEVMTYLTSINEQNTIVDVDIEVLREEISCIAFAYNAFDAMSIPFIDEHGNYWNPDEEAQIWRAIAQILENPLITKRGQNFLFDVSFLLQRHGIRTVNIADTMVAQGVLYPDFPKGLDFITSSYTKIPYYKDEGKKWQRISGDWRTHWEYNCKDVVATAQAYQAMITDLDRQKNIATYLRQVKLIEPLAAMQLRGIRMDTEGIKMALESATKELEYQTEEFYKACGREINPNSNKQLQEYFYGTLGISAYKNRKTGANTLDSTALVRISRKGYREAQVLQEVRRLTKLKSTYLEVGLDPDNRLRCAFNPVGTKTGRLSSGETIFETGTNLQNQPPEMKQLMLFDEGYVGYNIDLSQAENRIVAYVGPVPEMIQAFEEGRDVHRLTASLIFGKPESEISDEPGSTTIGGGAYSERFWGKKSNHSLNYDEGYKTFSLICEIPEPEGKFIVDRYHQSYPGVRQGYHSQVRSMLSRDRTVTNLLRRRRLFLDRWGDSLFKDAYAQIPQSSVADIINERGLEYIWYNNSMFQELELLIQVHDSIVFQLPLALPWHEHARMLRAIKLSLETQLEWRGRVFVIPVDLEMSIGNMGKYHPKKNPAGLQKIPSTTLLNVGTLEEALKRTYYEMRG